MPDHKKNQLELDTPLQFVKGLGPKLADIFKKYSLITVQDFILRFPKSYQDNRVISSLSDIVTDQSLIVVADVVQKNIIRGRYRRIYEIVLGDGSQLVSCKFFKMPYKSWFNSLRVGERVEVRGKASYYRGRIEFHHPQIFPAGPEDQAIKKDLLCPIYSEIDKVSQSKTRNIMREIFARLKVSESEWDWLPEWLKKKYSLTSRLKALKGIHFPLESRIDDYLNFKTEFQKRLIFDEFFEMQFYFALKNQGWRQGRANPIPTDKLNFLEIKKKLPFILTSAQEKTLQDIFSDFRSPHPMHRLLQGDVGCGKTVVALISALACAKAGYQSAIMAPTEILTHQHYKSAKKFLEPFGLKVEKLTGKMKSGEKRTTAGVLRSGFCHVCIGTQALIQEKIQFHNLGFVVVDEQHRFGAHQRALLKSKGRHPHFLVMTATPIPRTLSMAIYGDLDISVIDESPPGRIPITSKRVFPSKRKEVFDFLKEQVQKGRQGYVVYPLVEESEHLDLKNAMDQYEKLKSYYKDLRWGLLTGRMTPEEKREIMDRFLKGDIQVLVSTTVIEVGVDVPNANIMVVENAERFGLSQMHQLRGRVGRGAYKSYCIFVLGKHFSKEAGERAYIMQSSSDGFKIAEKDLEIRGPGEFLGSRQSGLPSFKIAHIIRDAKLLSLAKKAAFDLVSKDPQLKAPEHKKIKNKFKELSESIRPG